MEAAIERYPDLTFNGMLIHEAALQGGVYWVLTAANGEVQWRQFPCSGDYSPMAPDQIEQRITRIDKKIARLSTHRDLYLRQIHQIKGEIEKASDPASHSWPGVEG
jgi:hypothetical protein